MVYKNGRWDLRERTLKVIDKINFIPSWGKNRIGSNDGNKTMTGVYQDKEFGEFLYQYSIMMKQMKKYSIKKY